MNQHLPGLGTCPLDKLNHGVRKAGNVLRVAVRQVQRAVREVVRKAIRSRGAHTVQDVRHALFLQAGLVLSGVHATHKQQVVDGSQCGDALGQVRAWGVVRRACHHIVRVDFQLQAHRAPPAPTFLGRIRLGRTRRGRFCRKGGHIEHELRRFKHASTRASASASASTSTSTRTRTCARTSTSTSTGTRACRSTKQHRRRRRRRGREARGQRQAARLSCRGVSLLRRDD